MNDVVNDLVALVGGNTTRKQTDNSVGGRHLNIKVDRSNSNKIHKVFNNKHGLEKSDSVFHKIAKDSMNKKGHKFVKSLAEKVIPLNDKSTGDDDFKEFND